MVAIGMGLGLVAWTVGGAGEARAEVSCERPTEVEATLAVDGMAALVVRGVHAPVRIVAGDGPIRAVATTCSPDDVKVKLKRSGPAAVATLRGDASLVVHVPAALVTVTVEGLQGPLEVTDVPARLALVSTTGPAAVRGVHSVRAGYAEGPLTVTDVAGNVTVDEHTGDVSASAVHGDVTVDRIVGAVSVDGVDGQLAVTDNTGPVSQNNVRGATASH